MTKRSSPKLTPRQEPDVAVMPTTIPVQVKLEPPSLLSRVRVEQGDVLVLTTPGDVDKASAVRLKEKLGAYFGTTPVLILGNGVVLSVIRPAVSYVSSQPRQDQSDPPIGA